jgi:hypothetical protein
MSRALSIKHTVVPSADREAFRQRKRVTKSHYKGAGCNYWLFEEQSLPGAFVEFFEAPDAATLSSAHRDAPAAVVDASRLYVEVELT